MDSVLNEIMSELTGETYEEALDNDRGCYFSPGCWVSSKSIANALREAYESGEG